MPAVPFQAALIRHGTVTQAAAASGGLSWMFIEWLKHRKATSLGVASGILAGSLLQKKGAKLERCVTGALTTGTIYGYASLLNGFKKPGVSA